MERAAIGRAEGAFRLSARAAVRLMASGAMRCEDYCAVLLERARAFGRLNAFTWLDDGRVLRQAREIDRCGGVAPLRGLPIAVKDNISTVGFPTSAGTSVLGAYWPAEDAAIWTRLRERGSVLFGKTNMHELAAGGTSNNPIFGAVRHPFNEECMAGGSSGGSAAAVAASVVPIALGTDTSGSIRVPAALCGVVGFRPATFGQSDYPANGIVPLVAALDSVGMFARHVGDVHLIHEAMTGKRVISREAASAPRIGLGPRSFWEDLAPEVGAAARQTVDTLKSCGILVIDVDLSALAQTANSLQIELGRASRRDDLAGFLAQHSVGMDLATLVDGIRSQDVKLLYESRYPAAVHQRQAIRAALAAVRLELQEACARHNLDVLVYPTSPLTAPRLKEGPDQPGDQVELNGRAVDLGATLARHARFSSALGLPAISLPVPPATAGDLPVGLEIVSVDGSNETVLSAASLLESSLPPRRPVDKGSRH
jgi:indoleacetamide hydrolase